MVANYADGERRRFDSYANEADALSAADKLARRIDSRDYVAASMTKDQAIEYANAVARLKPFNLTVDAATATVVEAVKLVGDLPGVIAAARFYKTRNKTITPASVSGVVDELLKVKESRGASDRYLKDLRYRLGQFAGAFKSEIGNVETKMVQEWLDELKLSTQSYMNFRRVISLLFEFAVARGYAVDNVITGVESIKIRNGDVEIFTPGEIAALLTAADAEFLPSLTLGAFAGLRSAEIERLNWQDVDLTARHIIVAASAAKTASRRIVPVTDNLAAWLAPYTGRRGKIWPGSSIGFYKQMPATAKAAGVAWKQNALRHSFASYRLAQTQNAAQVALECGNSPKVIFRHYNQLVKPADAVIWFSIAPMCETLHVFASNIM